MHPIKSPTDSGISSPPDKGLLHSGLGSESAPQTRHSIRSIDSGLGEDPTNADRELASEVCVCVCVCALITEDQLVFTISFTSLPYLACVNV